jgi:endonuclease/exonuclease/phosphatase family metal-dependent hydrolase
VTVASVNMYFGAPVDHIIAAPPELVPFAVAEAWGIFLQTDFAARARATARQLAQVRPHLVGLQEVAQFWTEPQYDPTSTDNEELYADFLTTLLADLAARNLHYEVAASIELTNIELPKFEYWIEEPTIPFLSGIRLIDRDVILVRSDVEFTEAAMNRYGMWLGPGSTGGAVPIDVYRGWTAVTASVGGTEFRFVNTHLESEDQGGLWQIRTAQAIEFTATFAGEARPLIAVGDFNSGPGRPLAEGEPPDGIAYIVMLASGYRDTWDLQSGPMTWGFTCCHDGDLSNTGASLTQRIDLVFVKNMEGLGRRGSNVPIVHGTILNDERKDLRRFGTWSSDHAAPVAQLVLPAPRVAAK